MRQTVSVPFSIRIDFAPLPVLPFCQFYHFANFTTSAHLSVLPFFRMNIGRRPCLLLPFYHFRDPTGCTVLPLLHFRFFLPNIPFAYIAGGAILPGGISLAGLIVVADCAILQRHGLMGRVLSAMGRRRFGSCGYVDPARVIHGFD